MPVATLFIALPEFDRQAGERLAAAVADAADQPQFATHMARIRVGILGMGDHCQTGHEPPYENGFHRNQYTIDNSLQYRLYHFVAPD